MARPANADAEATRRRILESAIRLFSERGPGDTSIRDVVAASGVSLAMVHYYFVSKEQLYDASIVAIYEELAGLRVAIERAVRVSRSPDAALAQAVATSYRFAREHRIAVKLLLRTAIETGRISARGETLMAEFLDGASRLLGSFVGRPPESLRLPLQSAVFLIARYAVQDDAESASVVGLRNGRKRSARAVHDAIEAHLVDAVLAIVGIRPTRERSRP